MNLGNILTAIEAKFGGGIDADRLSQLYDDIRDGRYDGKSEAGEFFTKDF